MGRTGGARSEVSPRVARRLAEIEGCERRGESLKAYAARTGQSVAVFYEARRAARRAGVLPPLRGAKRRVRDAEARSATPRFVEAVRLRPERVAPQTAGSVAWRLRLPGGAVLESATPLDASLLGQLVTGAEDRS